MKYFKDEKNNVYAYESDGSQDEFIKPDLILISEEEAMELASPPPASEQLVAMADSQKTVLLLEADNEIAWRNDAIALDMATDEEKSDLTEWKRYRVRLSRVNTSTAPDINWPEKPEA